MLQACALALARCTQPGQCLFSVLPSLLQPTRIQWPQTQGSQKFSKGFSSGTRTRGHQMKLPQGTHTHPPQALFWINSPTLFTHSLKGILLFTHAALPVGLPVPSRNPTHQHSQADAQWRWHSRDTCSSNTKSSISWLLNTRNKITFGSI